jgi:hypothetical protein
MLPSELFQPVPSPRLTQCMWCCAANTANDISADSLSPLLAPELVKPAATLSLHAPLRQRRPVRSANAWKPADTFPMYVALPKMMPSAVSSRSQPDSDMASTAIDVTSAPPARAPDATADASVAVCPKPE